jgi:HAMP domain-containing protein
MSAGAPMPPNPPYPNIPPPPTTSGTTVLKIVLIVIAAIVLIGAIVAGVIGIGIYKIAKSAHKDASGNVSITTPGGTITTGQNTNVSAAELGVDLYPAVTTGEGSMNMKTPNGSVVTAVYLSSDPPDKIVAYYKERLGDKASIVQTSNGTVLSAGEKDRDNIVITVTPQGNSTKIAIVHVTSTKTE